MRTPTESTPYVYVDTAESKTDDFRLQFLAFLALYKAADSSESCSSMGGSWFDAWAGGSRVDLVRSGFIGVNQEPETVNFRSSEASGFRAEVSFWV